MSCRKNETVLFISRSEGGYMKTFRKTESVCLVAGYEQMIYSIAVWIHFLLVWILRYPEKFRTKF